MTTTANINFKLTANESGTSDFSGPNWGGAISYLKNLTNGTTADKIDLVFFDQRTVASATNDDIDLTGSLSTGIGTAFNAAEIVGFVVINAPISGAANTTDLTIGNGTNAWEGFISSGGTIGPISPGGIAFIINPDADGLGSVTAGTGDILRVANSSGASATYQIGILARSA